MARKIPENKSALYCEIDKELALQLKMMALQQGKRYNQLVEELLKEALEAKNKQK